MTWRTIPLFLLLLASTLIAACGGGSDTASSSNFRGVSTQSPDNVTTAGATLHALVNPGGLATTAWFEYGTDPALTGATRTATVAIPAGNSPVPVSTALSGLVPGTTYYFRAAGSNSSGTGPGATDYLGTETADNSALIVNCADDNAAPPPGKTTLRSAIARLDADGIITFAPRLDNTTIALSIVQDNHTILPAESFAGMVPLGYVDRDYGKSALYTQKGLTIDASGLTNGITVRWAGGDANRARILAVRGNLTMKNVTIRDGFASTEAITPPDPALDNQPYTLACGGGLAVWGVANLEYCKLVGNRVVGDNNSARDRGAFGGGLFTDTAVLNNCIVGGNSATGYGAAGGGVYSIGGYPTLADSGLSPALWSVLTNCTVSGNRATGHMAYGGGVFSDGGGAGNFNAITLKNCTIARNVVENYAAIPINSSLFDQYYWRGGGVYMSNGYMWLTSCTIAENDVSGHDNVFSGKSNMGGGGIGATVGSAHATEDMRIRHSIIVGNKLNGVANDVFTGSLIRFKSEGYNRIGKLDFKDILVPCPLFEDLNRKHYPKAGDVDGIDVGSVLSLSEVHRHASFVSAGTDNGQKLLLWYPPADGAIGKVPTSDYTVGTVEAGFYLNDAPNDNADDFLNRMTAIIAAYQGGVLGSDFAATMGDRTGVTFNYTGLKWPFAPVNAPWTSYWRTLDNVIGTRFGQAGLNDDFWGTLEAGPMGDSINLTVGRTESDPIRLTPYDQLGSNRPFTGNGAIGAIEPAGATGFWQSIVSLFN